MRDAQEISSSQGPPPIGETHISVIVPTPWWARQSTGDHTSTSISQATLMVLTGFHRTSSQNSSWQANPSGDWFPMEENTGGGRQCIQRADHTAITKRIQTATTCDRHAPPEGHAPTSSASGRAKPPLSYAVGCEVSHLSPVNRELSSVARKTRRHSPGMSVLCAPEPHCPRPRHRTAAVRVATFRLPLDRARSEEVPAELQHVLRHWMSRHQIRRTDGRPGAPVSSVRRPSAHR